MRSLLPSFLLARFADDSGRVMGERRDRSRRLLIPVAQAAVDAGVYDSGSPELDRLLDRIEARAAEAIAGVLGGTFPVRGEDRRYLSLFVGVQLLLGRGHREGRVRAADVLGSVIVSRLEEADEELPEPDADDASPAEDPARMALAGAPALARSVTNRTWQLVRFPTRLLLTGDTAVALWTRPGSDATRSGLGGADEVRFPLDPRHALVIARHAPAGEVIRDLDERHARALNRTVAEAAHEWMYYHPESDPLEAVELTRA